VLVATAVLLASPYSGLGGESTRPSRATEPLRSPFFLVRRDAREPDAATDSSRLARALEGLRAPDYRVRRASAALVARAIATAPDDSGLPEEEIARVEEALLAALLAESDLDTLRSMARDAARAGSRLLSRLRARDPGADHAEVDAVLLRAYVEGVLRDLLEEISSVQGSIKGFFRDPFEPILALGGDDLLEVLLEIARDPTFSESFRGLAVRALGEVGDRSLIEPLRELCALRREVVRRRERRPDLFLPVDGLVYRACRYVLYRLGAQIPFYERIEYLKDRRDSERSPFLKLEYEWQIAYEWHQVREFEEAVTRYQELIDRVESLPPAMAPRSLARISYYNLACILSLEGKVDQALEYLQDAVGAGFRDLEWILIDRDLVNLRADPGFRAIYEELNR